MRYIVISYDQNFICVKRLQAGSFPAAINILSPLNAEVAEANVLCQGSSFGDVVEALDVALLEEVQATQGSSTLTR